MSCEFSSTSASAEVALHFERSKVRAANYSCASLEKSGLLKTHTPTCLSSQRTSSRKTRCSKIKAAGILVSLYVLTNITYMLSLRSASSPEEMNGYLGVLGFLLITAVLLYSVHFWAACLFFTIAPRWRARSCLIQLLTYGTWYMIDSGNRLERHGAFNLLIFTVILVPTNALVLLLYLWYVATSPIPAKRRRRFGIQLSASVVVVIFFILFLARRKRNNLAYGFNQSIMACSSTERENGSCSSCQWREATPWFDFLPFRLNVFTGPMKCVEDHSFSATFVGDRLVVDCGAVKTQVNSWFNNSLIYEYSGAVYTVLPRTESWGLLFKKDSLYEEYNPFQANVLRFAEDHLKPYKGPVQIHGATDTVLVMCGNAPHKLVNRIIHAGITTNNNRLQTKEMNTNPKRLNVVTIFLDAVSRRQFHRRLPNTRRVLESTIKARNSTSTLFELFRYQIVGLNTGPNTRALWAGLDERGPGATGPPIWEQYQKAGYIAGRIDPMCQDWSAYYNQNHLPNTTVIEPRISHEYISWSCIPPYLPVGKHNNGNFAGPASIKARCLADTHVGWHELDWASDFISTYRHQDSAYSTEHSPDKDSASAANGQNYYLNAAFMEGHEGTGEVLRTLDARLAAFLDPATSPIDFHNTAVVIVSDHGARMGLNYAFFQNGKTEAANPAAIMLLPAWYVSGLPGERLRRASQRLVTAFDLYETMRGFMNEAGGDQSSKCAEAEGVRRGFDLLREDVGDRTCREAGIAQEFCQCIS